MHRCMPGLLVLTLLASASLASAIPGLTLLDDSNFESTTQASTGQSTGHWLVLFACPTELPPAQYQNVQLAAQKLAAEAWNKQYTFRIAEVNTCVSTNLAERFLIDGPEIILFRDRQMYALPKASLLGPGFNQEILKSFVLTEYELVVPSIVPAQHGLLAGLTSASPLKLLWELVSVLLFPAKAFWRAFNHLEDNGLRLFPIALGILLWTSPLTLGGLFAAYLGYKKLVARQKPKQQ